MQTLENAPLAPYTAFQVGGPAAKLLILNNANEVLQAHQKQFLTKPHWVLGYGTNCVISDKGLPGTVLMLRDGPTPSREHQTVVADAATNWDEVVRYAIEQDLWGLELMSGIPGNVGAGLTGNIAAYGQQFAHSFAWADILDLGSGQTKRLGQSDIEFSYRASSLQSQPDVIVLKVGLALSDQPNHELKYASALKVAQELGIEPTTLEARRQIILETRRRAGAIYDETDPSQEHTAGSFFKNPLVDRAVAEHLASFDESGKSVEELLEQNKIHGGNQYRVSAAHVLLAAGFQRGQSWGPVRLHPQHVLKIENTGSATAQQIYDVAHEIMRTVKASLGIDLEPEVRWLGEFT